MPGPLIFITGGTGFIGAHTVLASLEAGYRVRLSIRKPEQEATIFERYPNFASNIETVLITDFSNPDSFKKALGGVEYVFHLASPMPGAGTDVRKDYVEPAVDATLSVLKAALDFEEIKTLIVMSSVVALLPADTLTRIGEDIHAKDNTGDVIPVDLDRDFPPDLFGHAVRYASSKILAHQATRDFLSQQRPHYKLLTLHPAYVMGNDLTQTTAEGLGGINGMFFMSLGSEKPILGTAWVHVKDIAEAHVRAIQSEVDTGKEFLLSGPPFPWEDAIEYVKEKYPDLEVKLAPPFEGRWSADVSFAEKVLGMKWRSKESILDDLIGQQLQLRAQTGGAGDAKI
ncbi:hypothetical protein BDV96DRAFT_601644 [Lophiotrema nucula]|uniref:NAD-dependent epimerase/dehydratase domain-containing protein n=1 Tax=Lophiotrema nucula TaxID=690887 RepID=A0A6A5Z1A8_9PLEO|nr:hypothetical protein BDV96DRAFT_601644 [Lophiotrema nucula]